MKVTDLKVGSKVVFVPCEGCKSRPALRCLLCKPKVKPRGTVVACYPDFPIPTVEVKVVGAEKLYELTQDDLDNPDIVKSVKV